MPDNKEQPVFWVDAYSDPVLLRIEGRASFLNAAPVRELFEQVIGDGRRRVIVDFQRCTSMDSTFLGILTGAALKMRKTTPPGQIVLARLSDRNLELVRNLGLHRLLTVDQSNEQPAFNKSSPPKQLSPGAVLKQEENERLVLEAHESLVEADESNYRKFQDVLSFLRVKLDKGGEESS